MLFTRNRGPAPDLLVVGLGNPGVKFAVTRHNVGWWILDELARGTRITRTAALHQSQADFCRLADVACVLIKPTTFMNRSGQSVARWKRAYPQARMVVLHDDIALPVGKVRLKRKGSAGGHHGVESIIECLGHEDFDRIKVGVGAPPSPEEGADWVLNRPTPAEEELLGPAVQRAVQAVLAIALGDYDEALRRLS